MQAGQPRRLGQPPVGPLARFFPTVGRHILFYREPLLMRELEGTHCAATHQSEVIGHDSWPYILLRLCGRWSSDSHLIQVLI
jgi:hypothetical protein